jgi:hypothetical protein
VDGRSRIRESNFVQQKKSWIYSEGFVGPSLCLFWSTFRKDYFGRIF